MRRIAVVGALLLALSGCAQQSGPDYGPDTAAGLQAGVLSVTESAAAGDPDAALARLDELQASLLEQQDAGAVSQSRFESISAAIALVRADLELAIRERDAAEESENSGPGNSGPGNSDKPGKPEKPGKPGKDG